MWVKSAEFLCYGTNEGLRNSCKLHGMVWTATLDFYCLWTVLTSIYNWSFVRKKKNIRLSIWVASLKLKGPLTYASFVLLYFHHLHYLLSFASSYIPFPLLLFLCFLSLSFSFYIWYLGISMKDWSWHSIYFRFSFKFTITKELIIYIYIYRKIYHDMVCIHLFF